MNEFAWWMAQNAAVTALLVPLVWLVCRARRARPAEQHLLWLLLLVKLVTPPVIQWPWSLDDLQAWQAPKAEVPKTETPVTPPRLTKPDPLIDTTVLPADQVTEIVIAPAQMLVPEASTVEAVAFEPLPRLSDPPAEPAASVPTEKFDLPTLALRGAMATWLLGGALVALRTIWHIRRQRLILRNSQEAPPALRRFASEATTSLGLRPVAVRVSSHTDSPFVSCLGRPVLVWPASLSADDALANARAVIAHELAHVRRRDHWVARLEAVAAPVWWWNPMFWYVRRRLDETRELACDALALESAPAERRALAELLLTFSVSPRPALPFAPLRTGIAPRHSLRKRLAMLFDDSVSGRVSSAGLALAGLLAVAALPGWVRGQEEPPATPSAEPIAIGTTTEPGNATGTDAGGEPAAAIVSEPAQPVPATPTAENAPATPTASDYAFPIQPAQPPQPGAAPATSVPLTPSAADPAAPAPEQPVQSSQAGIPQSGVPQAGVPQTGLPATALTPTPTLEPPSPNVRQVQFGEGKVVLLEPTEGGIVLTFIENGQPGPKVLLNGVTFQPNEVPALDRRRTRATPAAPARRAEPQLAPSTSLPGEVALPPRTATRSGTTTSATRILFLQTAVELAQLEVEEKKVLLEQGRDEAARQQQLYEKGYSAERPRDLRLLEIDLRKAELKAKQAAIELEDARAPAAEGRGF